MINRTFKFYIQAFSPSESATVAVIFNGEQVYSGSVPAVNSLINSPVPTAVTDVDSLVFEYDVPIDTVGQIPFELTVQGGTVFFGKVDANYSGVDAYIDNTDLDTPTVVVNTAPENFWHSVNNKSIESDGKTNVMIDGVEQIRNLLDTTQLGDWWYRIPDNSTLTCNILVEPEIIVLAVPTLEELVARQNDPAP
jgi:hypothetical protein